MLKKLTGRQKEVLDFIVEYVKNNNVSPTLREIGAALGITSTNGVNDHLKILKYKGWLRPAPEQKSRHIRLSLAAQQAYDYFLPEVSAQFMNSINKYLESFQEEIDVELEGKKTAKEGALHVIETIKKILLGDY